LPGSNAGVERAFSLMKFTCTKSQNKLDMKIVEASLIIHVSHIIIVLSLYISMVVNKKARYAAAYIKGGPGILDPPEPLKKI
jgi:hypothetical protein